MNNSALNRETFVRGMQLIASILSKKVSETFNNQLTVDSYYLLLKDLPNEFFLFGIMDLAKSWDNVHFVPSPSQIRSKVLEYAYCGYSEEEYNNLLKVKTITHVIYSDQKLERSLSYFIDNNIQINNTKSINS